MTPKAILQGEYHASGKDAEELMERRTEETEAIFIEGRSKDIRLKPTRKYFLFVVGYLIVLALQPKREGENIEGLYVHSEIDAELDEMWQMSRGKRDYLFWASVVFLFVCVTVSSIGLVDLIPPGLFSAIVISGTPLLFTGLVILSLGKKEKRDEIMVDSIVETSERHSYSEVLILCGDKHVPGIKQRLEEKDWKVDDERSKHVISRLLRVLRQI